MRSTLASAAVFSLLLGSMPSVVHAYAATNPNIIRKMNQRNFRLPVGDIEKYKQTRRARERRGLDAFTIPEGEDSSFDRRAEYLRETQLRRIKEDLEARKYSGERRSTPLFWDRANRSRPTTLRRINQARDAGGIRLRQGTATLQKIQGLSSQEKKERIDTYRAEVKDAERARYDFTRHTDCSRMRGRRQAQCWYNHRSR